jgi:hypothetical protein
MKFIALAIVFSISWFSCYTLATQPITPTDPNILSDTLNIKSESEYFPRQIVTGPKAWAAACCALLTERNRGWHDTLSIHPLNAFSIQNRKDGLDEWWGIKNKDDLTRILYWLETSGHRSQFQKLGRQIEKLNFAEFSNMLQKTTDKERQNELRIVHQYYKKLGKKSLVGWDFERAIFLCRAGYECGYISENEAWYRIMNYAQLLQQTFDSWEDLGRNYLIGREFWSYKHTSETGDEFNDTLMRLLEMPSSPWNTLDWNMDILNGEANDDE